MINLAILISGGGTTAEAIIKACKKKQLKGIAPHVLISSRKDAGGIQKAKALGIKNIFIVQPQNFSTQEKFGNELLKIFKKYKINLISQNGWLPLTPFNVVKQFSGRIINQHPGPLDYQRPDFGGKGMYGKRVHCAVLYFRRKTNHDFWTEAISHLVTNKYDEGQMIKRKRINIFKDDTVETLQQKVLPIEHEAQIEALQDFVNNKVAIYKREKPLIKKNEYAILEEAKKIAGLLYPKG